MNYEGIGLRQPQWGNGRPQWGVKQTRTQWGEDKHTLARMMKVNMYDDLEVYMWV